MDGGLRLQWYCGPLLVVYKHLMALIPLLLHSAQSAFHTLHVIVDIWGTVVVIVVILVDGGLCSNLLG